ncbi:hypothetical protein DFH06DRAFT_154192 [Mycena polygramma]|nr:hypothetical protein DFH06DRAFT_154192 [Mycena polygramma]
MSRASCCAHKLTTPPILFTVLPLPPPMQNTSSFSKALTLRSDAALMPASASHGPLVLGSLSAAGPGRILNEMYSSLGHKLEKRVNRIAHGAGLGPAAIADRIRIYLGEGEECYLKLENLTLAPPPQIEKYCARIIHYSLPEAASTQIAAFTSIIELSTSFPGMRALFHQTIVLQRLPRCKEKLLILWDRSEEYVDPRWNFFRNLAATCLFDEDIAPITEGASLRGLTSHRTESGSLTPIERLLVAYDCQRSSPVTGALAIRYLAGILQLPAFWLGGGASHEHLVKKICSAMVEILQDHGVHTTGVEVADHVFRDLEGVDTLMDAILAGLLLWSGGLVFEQVRCCTWYKVFMQAVEILTNPDVEALFPRAWTRVDRHDLGSLLPRIYERDDEQGEPGVEETRGVGQKISLLKSFTDFATTTRPVLLVTRQWKLRFGLDRQHVVTGKGRVSTEQQVPIPSSTSTDVEGSNGDLLASTRLKPATARFWEISIWERQHVFFWNGDGHVVHSVVQGTRWADHHKEFVIALLRTANGHRVILPLGSFNNNEQCTWLDTEPDSNWCGRRVSWVYEYIKHDSTALGPINTLFEKSHLRGTVRDVRPFLQVWASGC